MKSRLTAVLDALAIACTAALAVHVLFEEAFVGVLLAAAEIAGRSIRLLQDQSAIDLATLSIGGLTLVGMAGLGARGLTSAWKVNSRPLAVGAMLLSVVVPTEHWLLALPVIMLVIGGYRVCGRIVAGEWRARLLLRPGPSRRSQWRSMVMCLVTEASLLVMRWTPLAVSAAT